MEMSGHAPSGWYKCKLRDYWTGQWVVVYYDKDRMEFYFGLNRLTPERVIEVREYVMDVNGNPHNNFAH